MAIGKNTQRASLLLAIDGMTDEAFGWLLAVIAADGLGCFQPKSQDSIRAVKAECIKISGALKDEDQRSLNHVQADTVKPVVLSRKAFELSLGMHQRDV